MSDRTPTFFVIDVETTHTDPLRGHLLTIGVQPVRCTNNEWGNPWRTAETLYLRIDQYEHYDQFFGGLLDPRSTISWWVKQDQRAQDEAWRDMALERVKQEHAAELLTRFVESIEPDFNQRVFVGNPVAFDKSWIDALYSREPFASNPFPHRCLCLRSMRFGLKAGNDWSPVRPVHDPEIPHHALHDAIAQAVDLCHLLRDREGTQQ